MPAGSSLQETNRVLRHVEAILRDTPEVESTSRRTGLELGLAAVTEPNTGDIAVKLKADRSRSVDDVISDVRAKVVSSEPGLDVEFIQVLQDMIGDLTGAPEPVVVKLFSPDPDLLSTWAPQVAEALEKVTIGGKTPVVDVEDGIENTTSGPALRFTVNPEAADRAGFSAEELGTVGVAMVEGEPATESVHRSTIGPIPLRVRFPSARHASSLEAMSNTMLVSSTGATATLGSLTTIDELPGQTEVRRENLQRLVEVTARLEGVDMGTGVAAVQKAVADLKLPPSIRVEYGGTYREQQKSFRDLARRARARGRADLPRAAVRVPIVHAAGRDSVVGDSVDIGRLSRAARHTHDLQRRVVHGPDHGDRHRRQERHPAARREREVSGRSDSRPEEAIIQAGRRRLRPIVMTALAAVAGMLPLALALGAGSQMLQPLAIAVIGGILISMVLSLIVTPAMQYFLTRRNSRDRVIE